ncbi:CHK2 DNA damage checkpoint kinase [Guillardia theta CCMP2712]|uniref:CHK2 DNA damage checkpoint kinase n=2 Tax=Guillardia theta TaxID=55529 RepID=L1J1B9_GUITC|nr:CHK2 DNA damage checkpoint kinase [Guillardia theta CCMP2712]EKX42291.1 CHK2 DNA damage checkpoint kinase [Guillardia theta CCMP2712]|eukprot:XP_005829271.1 CHK2 DNA damage checkpoint kinase [Guillardia theta CCMP2712]
MLPIFSFLSSAVKREYDIESKTIGQGKFAKVYKARHKASGNEVAIKVISKDKCKKDEDLKRLQEEIEIMKKVKHPHCIQFLEMFDSNSKLYIVMELVTGGELFDRIIAKEKYSEKDAAHVFIQIVKAVDYLHSIGIVHRDIKPENVLYANMREDSPIKLADFGLGKIIDIHEHDKVKTMTTLCGTPSYLAPEVIMRKGYGMECDIWSTGVILYILLSGMPPFDQTSPPAVLFSHITKARYSFPDAFWSGVSAQAKDLIRNMMHVDPKKRFTPAQVFQHSWMKAYKEDELPTEQLGGDAGNVQERLQELQVASRRLKGAVNTFAALLRMSRPLASFPDEGERKSILESVKSDPIRLEVLKESFDMLDRDHTGFIDLTNLTESLRALGIDRSEKQIKDMMDHFDVLRNGTISFDEYCMMMGPGHYNEHGYSKSMENELRSIFHAFDLQRTGSINGRELREILHRLGTDLSDSELDAMVSSADRNKDGVIDWDEFKHFMLSQVYANG